MKKKKPPNGSNEKEISVTVLEAEKPCNYDVLRADFGDGHKSILPLVRYLSESALLRGFQVFQKRDVNYITVF